MTIEGVVPSSPSGFLVSAIRAHNGFATGRLYWEIRIDNLPEDGYRLSLGVDGSDFGAGEQLGEVTRVMSQTLEFYATTERLWGITLRKSGTSAASAIVTGRGGVGFVEAIAVVEGDWLRFYLEPASGDFWIGKGTNWIRGGNPATGDTPTLTDVAPDPAGFWGDLRPLAALSHGARVTANFGDQPWEGGGPPAGATGVPYVRYTGYARQVWDTDTASEDGDGLVGLRLEHNGVVSPTAHRELGTVAWFLRNEPIEAPHSVLGSFPRSTGRLQFEVKLVYGLSAISAAGLVPADWDNTTALVRPGLEAGTFGFRFGSGGTGPGVSPGEIHVDGVEQAETMPLSVAGDIVTFDCNFAAEEVTLYHNGTLVGTFALPPAPPGGWVPAVAGGTGAAIQLITTGLTYPVAGATNWNPAEVVPVFRNRITTTGDRRVTTAGDVRTTKE